MRISLTLITFLISLNTEALDFTQAKRILESKIYKSHQKTFYCDCSYKSRRVSPDKCGVITKKYKKRKYKLEWEHVVPAHAFGQSFPEWRKAKTVCPKKNGKHLSSRNCARKMNPLFKEMEGNLFNLVPSVGSINALRRNYSFSEIGESNGNLCDGGFKLFKRKVMPPNSRKGDIARIYYYMNYKFPNRGIISKKNIKLFEAWNKLDPVDSEECIINKLKSKYQGEKNMFVMQYCSTEGSK